ncbi:protein diaphanous homolog 1-like [Choloepus didactylus]|uniref:protein diaphanous homolog 1-like n=1 Tax=Choloepus didactylus TaxID=27675 RepID=UPI00189E613B|nr:protein diaphanous homolog 1-like [Choloepus didactylus]
MGPKGAILEVDIHVPGPRALPACSGHTPGLPGWLQVGVVSPFSAEDLGRGRIPRASPWRILDKHRPRPWRCPSSPHLPGSGAGPKASILQPGSARGPARGPTARPSRGAPPASGACGAVGLRLFPGPEEQGARLPPLTPPASFPRAEGAGRTGPHQGLDKGR